jgi:hypoxanthine phosphoribosyltransferase
MWCRRIEKMNIARFGFSIAHKLESFCPDRIVYIARGGEALGKVVADELGLPLTELDLRYPVSRLISSASPLFRLVLILFKEVAYRLTVPSTGQPMAPLSAGERVALIDDSASSGKTLRKAISILEDAGVDKSRIRVAVIRCGKRARSIVDFYECH